MTAVTILEYFSRVGWWAESRQSLSKTVKFYVPNFNLFKIFCVFVRHFTLPQNVQHFDKWTIEENTQLHIMGCDAGYACNDCMPSQSYAVLKENPYRIADLGCQSETFNFEIITIWVEVLCVSTSRIFYFSRSDPAAGPEVQWPGRPGPARAWTSARWLPCRRQSMGSFL